MPLHTHQKGYNQKTVVRNTGKDVEKLKHLSTAGGNTVGTWWELVGKAVGTGGNAVGTGGNADWCSCWGDTLADPQKVEHRTPRGARNSTPQHGLKTKNMSPPKHSYMDV